MKHDRATSGWTGLTLAVAALALSGLAACGSSQDRALKSVTRFEQYYAARDFVDARNEIKKAIAIQDDVTEYWNRLGRAELGLHNYYPAYVAYERALELDKNDTEALQAMAELAYSGGKPEDAVRLADQMLAKEPRTLRMLLVKGAVAADNRDFAQARELVRTMLAIDPQNEGAIVLLGRVLMANDESAKGASLIEGSIAKTGPTMLKLRTLVDLYSAQHDADGIIRTYRRMFSLDHDSVELRLDYAKALYENDQSAHALAVIDQLLRARPHDVDLKRQVIDLWDMVGSDAVNLDEARRIAGSNDEMKMALANLAVDQGRFAEAVTMVLPFIGDSKINPDNAAAHVLYARAASGLGRKQEALDRVNRVLAFDSTNPDALLLRVDIEIDRKALDAALNDAQILARDNPASDLARLAVGRVYAARGDQVMADTSFAGALNDIPDSVDIVKTYTAWLIATNRPKMALDVAERFTGHNPRLLKGWANRADLCTRLDDRDCMKDVADALDGLHGGQKMRATLIAAMQAKHAA